MTGNEITIILDFNPMKSNTKEETLNWLYSLHRFGIKPGLERISALLNFLGNPEKKFQSIHITGTNGKGTTAVHFSSIFKESNYKTALYTSPHLVNFNERIQINGKQIPDDVLVSYASDLTRIQEKFNATFFELTTAIAFKYFAENNVDIAIVEAGMGGINDATNVLSPLLSVITPISLDHQEYLGNTLQEIAIDKSGIIKPNSKTLISDDNAILKPIFNNIANKQNNTLVFLDNYKLDIQSKLNAHFENLVKMSIDEDLFDFKTTFLGKHQIRNIAAAIIGSQLIKDDFPLSKSQQISGVENVLQNFFFKGRFQFLNTEPLQIIDGAHNPSAFEKLLNQVEILTISNKLNLVLAIMKDKDIIKITELIADKFNFYILTKPQIERAAEPEIIRSALLKNNIPPNRIICTKNVNEALSVAQQLNQNTLFAGSFYLIGEILSN